MKLRAATRAELELVLEWAATEGWNPGLDDAHAFFEADPDGFFVAVDNETPVAAVSVVNHSDSYAFLGLYICQQERRGQGTGYALWQYALQHAGERVVGLDGVADQQENYTKSGFQRLGSTLRFEGCLKAETDPNISSLCQGDRHAVWTLDKTANGITRNGFLSSWTKATPTRQTLVLKEQSSVVGFATARLCQNGVKIGPIVAPSSAVALRLARACCAALPSEEVIIDVPESNVELIELLRSSEFRQTFTTARMYKGPPPEIDGSLQAIATMELG